MAILYKANETDFNHLGLGPLNEAVSILVTEERNGTFELEMEYPVEGNQFNELKLDRLIKSGAGHKLKNQRFKIIRITKPMNGVVTVNAEHVSYLSQDLALKPVVNYSGNASVGLNIWKNNIVDEHPFTVYSDITTTSSGKWSITELSNARQALGGITGSILDSYGGEYVFDNYDIRLYTNRGKQSDALIAYGRNLTELTQEETIDSTYTSIYPYAVLNENEQETILTLPEYFVDSEYVSNYARRKILKVDFSQDGVSTIERLRAKAKTYIKSNDVGIPKVNLKVKFIDLAKTLDYKNMQLVEQLDLCDWVTVHFEKFNIKTNAKVIKVIWDDLLEQYDSIEIGEARASLSDSIDATIDGKLETVTKNLNTIERAANGKNKVFRGVDEPLTGMTLNDLWYKPVGSGEVEMYIFDGAYWQLEAYSGDAIKGTVNFANVNAINLNLNALTTATITGPNMEHNLILGESTYYNPTTGDTLVLSQGKVQFQKGLQGRTLQYNDGGILLRPNNSNTGTALNTGFIMEGGVTFVQFNNRAGTVQHGRLEMTSETAKLQIPVGSEFAIRDTNDNQAGMSVNYITTEHGTGYTIQMAGDSIKTPRSGDRNIYVAPNGTGSVVAGEASGTRYNMVASDFVKQSTRDSKVEISPILTKGIDVINRLSPVSYKKKDKLSRGIDEVEVGFIAEDSPEVATTDEQGIYDSHILTYAVKAIQELDAENKSLKQETKEIKQHLGLA